MNAGQDKTGFWTIVIGVPVLLSVLRLWVEAGGELQTTLLLVAHVDPINLIAALIATGSWLAAAMFVAALAIGGVLNAAGPDGQQTWLARWASQAPPWVKFASFAVAAFTWQLLYLPLLLVAACAAFQLSPWAGGRVSRLTGSAIAVTLLAAYGVVIGHTLAAAWSLPNPVARTIVMSLLAGPPLLALFVAGPLSPVAVRPFAIGVQLVAVALVGWAVVPLVTTPVLPLTVTVVAAEEPDAPADYIRGHVITTDDVNTVVLEENGQVRYLPNNRIKSQDLCPTSGEIPRYRPRFLFPGAEPISLEQSVLSGLGNANRGTAPVNHACRARLAPR